MASQRVLAALVVVVGVVALGAAAGGFDQPISGSGPGEPVNQESGQGSGQSGEGVQSGADPGGSPIALPDWAFQALFMLTIGLGAILGIVWAGYLYLTDGIGGLAEIVRRTWDSFFAMGLVLAFGIVLLWVVPTESLFGAPSSSPPDPGGGGPDLQMNEDAVMPMVLLLVLAAAWVVGAVFLYRYFGDGGASSGNVETDNEPEEPMADPTTEYVAPSPRTDEDPDNPVYRAWYRLARTTGAAHERTQTPGEVADAAIDQGHPRDAVRTITDVFSEVRYGHQPITDERERRAESALQRIEGSGGDA